MSKHIVLFTQENCPRCNIIKTKLSSKEVSFQESKNMEVLKEKGFLTVPVLNVGEDYLDFLKANEWINNN